MAVQFMGWLSHELGLGVWWTRQPRKSWTGNVVNSQVDDFTFLTDRVVSSTKNYMLLKFYLRIYYTIGRNHNYYYHLFYKRGEARSPHKIPRLRQHKFYAYTALSNDLENKTYTRTYEWYNA